ncbi:hypothetical protein D9M73_138680 [compost metagenome]
MRLCLLHAGDHARQRADAAHTLHLRKLRAQIVHVEQALGELGRHLLGIFDLDRLGRALDQADHVAHAEDAPSDALRIKRLQRIELFAHARELDRLAGDGAHRQCRTAARIAVHTSQHDTGQRDLIGEILGDVDRVLTGQRIDHQQDLGRLGHLGDRAHFVHQRLIDVQATGGIEHQDIIALQLRRLQCAPCDIDRLLPGDDRQGRNLGLRAEHRQLLLRIRAVDVERRHQHLLALLLGEAQRDLRGRRGLARALQTDHHHDRRRRHIEFEIRRFGPEHFDQRVVDDLDDLLARRDRTQHVLADRLFGHLVDEIARHRQRDVGFEQRHAHFAHRRAHVGIGERTAPPQPIEHTAKTVAQALEHPKKPFSKVAFAQ